MQCNWSILHYLIFLGRDGDPMDAGETWAPGGCADKLYKARLYNSSTECGGALRAVCPVWHRLSPTRRRQLSTEQSYTSHGCGEMWAQPQEEVSAWTLLLSMFLALGGKWHEFTNLHDKYIFTTTLCLKELKYQNPKPIYRLASKGWEKSCSDLDVTSRSSY